MIRTWISKNNIVVRFLARWYFTIGMISKSQEVIKVVEILSFLDFLFAVQHLVLYILQIPGRYFNYSSSLPFPSLPSLLHMEDTSFLKDTSLLKDTSFLEDTGFLEDTSFLLLLPSLYYIGKTRASKAAFEMACSSRWLRVASLIRRRCWIFKAASCLVIRPVSQFL